MQLVGIEEAHTSGFPSMGSSGMCSNFSAAIAAARFHLLLLWDINANFLHQLRESFPSFHERILKEVKDKATSSSTKITIKHVKVPSRA